MKNSAIVLILSLSLAIPVAVGCGKVAVVNTSPPDGQNNVPVDTTIEVTYERMVRKSTVTDSSFFLQEEGSSDTVDGEISHKGDFKTWILTPKQTLQYGKQYVATVTSDIKDFDNNPGEEKRWAFSTEEAPKVEEPQSRE
ncbi:MAG: Ig-like domain-containing protein [bacterium]